MVFVDAEMAAVLALVKETALEKLAAVVDWEQFREVLESLWPRTVADGSPGRPSWDAVKMFKVLVYGKFYGNLSDERLEEACRVNLRVKNFVGLGFRVSQDEKTIHKYRSVLAASGRMEEVFDVFRMQLQAEGFEITEGTMIDASLIAMPVRRKVAPNRDCQEFRVWRSLMFFQAWKNIKTKLFINSSHFQLPRQPTLRRIKTPFKMDHKLALDGLPIRDIGCVHFTLASRKAKYINFLAAPHS